MRRASTLALSLLVVGATACGGDAGATPGPPLEPTIPVVADRGAPPSARSVRAEVAAAYRRAWSVYRRAVGGPDAGPLPLAFSGPALALKRAEVADLARQGQAVRVEVVHHPEITLVDERTALVTDRLENHMVLVDADTRRPLEPDPDDVLVRAYTLRRHRGTWTVTEAVALP